MTIIAEVGAAKRVPVFSRFAMMKAWAAKLGRDARRGAVARRLPYGRRGLRLLRPARWPATWRAKRKPPSRPRSSTDAAPPPAIAQRRHSQPLPRPSRRESTPRRRRLTRPASRWNRRGERSRSADARHPDRQLRQLHLQPRPLFRRAGGGGVGVAQRRDQRRRRRSPRGPTPSCCRPAPARPTKRASASISFARRAGRRRSSASASATRRSARPSAAR